MTRRHIEGQIGRTLGKKLESKWIDVDGQRIQVELRTSRSSGPNYDFTAVYAYGDNTYECCTQATAAEAYAELRKRLKESLAVRWDRKIYIYLEHGADNRLGSSSQYLKYGRKLELGIGVVDTGEANGETLYRIVNVHDAAPFDSEEREWKFSPEPRSSTSGPSARHGEFFGDLQGAALIPFTTERWERLLLILEQLENLSETLRQLMTGPDSDAIVAAISRVALPAPDSE